MQLQLSSFSNLSSLEQRKAVEYGAGSSQCIAFDFIHHAIEHWVDETPEAKAVSVSNEILTYSELDAKAEKLACELRRLGVGQGDNVGLFIERSIAMIVGIFAILKTGAAYVPQDARIAPKETLNTVFETADINIVITLNKFHSFIPHKASVVFISDVGDYLYSENRSSISKKIPSYNTPSHCFILFTSGTTGKPNGVQVTHRNVCNILLTEPGGLKIKPGDKVAQMLNIAFDMAAWEILGCLSHGGHLVIRGKDFTETAKQCQILVATPSILARIDKQACREVKRVVVAGEPCPRNLADKWAVDCEFINGCGPTETTIINTAQHYTLNSEYLTIGKPTPNNTVYILDSELKPCPIGQIGELWAGGDCVSDGYINNVQLTEERYRPDPFLGGERKMFRTRDLGRWNEHGEIEHLGRTDDQVKVKGFRVELDSISTVMEGVEGCEQAIVMKMNQQELIAFVRPASVNVELCQKAIAQSLPYYCQPSAILPIEHFPVTSRGKADKRALLEQAKETLCFKKSSNEVA